MKKKEQIDWNEKIKKQSSSRSLHYQATRWLGMLISLIWIVAFLSDSSNQFVALLWIIVTPFALISSLISLMKEEKKLIPALVFIESLFLMILFTIGLVSGSA